MKNQPNTILTFTDFGTAGPYLGQMEAAIKQESVAASVIHLQSDAPACDPKSAGYLLAALANQFDAAVFLCVVDPGVGSKVPHDDEGIPAESKAWLLQSQRD